MKISADIKNSNDSFLTLAFPNAIVKISFADISDEENKRRIKKIRSVAAELLKEVRRKNEFIGEKENDSIVNHDYR